MVIFVMQNIRSSPQLHLRLVASCPLYRKSLLGPPSPLLVLHSSSDRSGNNTAFQV